MALFVAAATALGALEQLPGAKSVSCVNVSLQHVESALTETAVVIRPRAGQALGLRVAPLGGSPRILGFWSE